jgi:mono/diheme cytochrome c family protein
MKLATLVAILVCFASTTVFAGAGNAEAGKATFEKRCAICHGKTGAGDGPAGKAFKGVIPDLSSKEVQSLKDADIAKVITEGKGKMTAVKDLNKDDIANLTAFIRTLAKK